MECGVIHIGNHWRSRWQINIVITYFPRENITTPMVLKDKILSRGGLLVITPNEILFIYQTDLVKSLQIPLNDSNLEKFPFLPQNFVPEFVGSFELSFSCNALQLSTPGLIWLILSIQPKEFIASINTKTIDTINMMDWHCRPRQSSFTTDIYFFICLID